MPSLLHISSAVTPLESLQTESRLLHLLHHRNRNQHRRSTWYRHLTAFRRALRDLLASFTLPHSRNIDHPKYSAPGVLISAPAPAHAKLATAADLARFSARWPVPAWHAAFSSLLAAGSGQFAPLGLALLGVLAKVCAVVGTTARMEAERRRIQEEEERAREAEVQKVLQTFREEQWGRNNDGMADDEDTGEVVVDVRPDAMKMHLAKEVYETSSSDPTESSVAGANQKDKKTTLKKEKGETVEQIQPYSLTEA